MQIQYNKIILASVLLGASTVSYAQFISDPFANRPYYNYPSDLDGTPLLFPDWNEGTIQGENGIVYKGVKVNYDVLSRSILFLLNDNRFVFNEPVKGFTVESGAEKRIRQFSRSATVHTDLPFGFVEVLVAGKSSFYKHVEKRVIEIPEYNSVGKKRIEEKIRYYLLRDGNCTLMTLNKKSLQEICSSEWTTIEPTLNKQKLSPKTEAGWIETLRLLNDK
jgi:hypothetical protein